MLLGPDQALAGFPGENGKIAFTRIDFFSSPSYNDLFTINPDGTGLTRLTDAPGADYLPAWSPDGKKIAFISNRVDPSCTSPDCNWEIFAMNADGSQVTNLTNHPASERSTANDRPAWSPDGQKIAFVSLRDGDAEIYVMNADGSDQINISNSPGTGDYEPSWSPDGERIAFRRQCLPSSACDAEIYLMNPDGSNQIAITDNTVSDSGPNWSPDGGRIAFTSTNNIWTMHADGTMRAQVTNLSGGENAPAWSPDGTRIAFHNSVCDESFCYPDEIYTIKPDGSDLFKLNNTAQVNDLYTDWQPIIKGHVRPQGARNIRVPLAIAYDQCSPPGNRSHSGGLSFPSCSPAVQESSWLTVGTLDSNGKPTQANAVVRFFVLPGTSTPADDADVRVQALFTDVRCRAGTAGSQGRCEGDALSDYTGELEIRASIRMTDKNNSPAPSGGGSGTVLDLPFVFLVECAATSSPEDVGATCPLDSTMDALVPGTVIEGMRSNWEVGQIAVSDGGQDGLTATTSDDQKAFAKQGIFVP